MSLRPTQTLKDAIADDGRFVFFLLCFLKIALGGKQSPFFLVCFVLCCENGKRDSVRVVPYRFNTYIWAGVSRVLIRFEMCWV